MIYELDVDQTKAANAIDGDYVCIAGPGSGKTTTLVARHRNILHKGVLAKDILNLTFTAAAAENMASKVGLVDAKKVFRTFHSFALDLVQTEKQFLPFKAGDFILRNDLRIQLLKDLMKMYPAITSYRSLNEKLSEWKATGVTPAQALEETYNGNKADFFYAAAYRDYEVKCRQQGWLDFDGIIKEAVSLLEKNDDVRKRHQRKYISVDECQDTDLAQFRLLQLIYSGNIFVVGDENQLIYEWRNAVAGNLSNFAKHFPGSTTLFLGKNYRSTKQLVEFFKKILPVDNGIASYMRSDREDGVRPSVTRYEDDLQEAYRVVQKIGPDLNDSVVIARTNRQLRNFQKVAMQQGIKTMILGQKDLWQTNEVKSLLDKAKEHSADQRPASTVLSEILTRSGLTRLYSNTGGPNEKPPVENLNDIVKLSANRGTTAEFMTWLRKLSYACEAAKAPDYEGRGKNPVLALTTVHQAKGREWKNVYVIGAKQGLMPHKDGDWLEEKRTFFVACTRAADRLNISYYGTMTEFLNGVQEEV